jgi:hypothetical protein
VATDRNDALLGQILGALGAIGEQLGEIRDRLPVTASADGEPDPVPAPEEEVPVRLTEPEPPGTANTVEAEPVALAEPEQVTTPAKKAPGTRRNAKKTPKEKS